MSILFLFLTLCDFTLLLLDYHQFSLFGYSNFQMLEILMGLESLILSLVLETEMGLKY